MKKYLFFKSKIQNLRLPKRLFFGFLFLLLSVAGWSQYTQVTALSDLTTGTYLIGGDGTTNRGLMENTVDSTPYISYSTISALGTTINTGYTTANEFTVTVTGTTTKTITIYNASVGFVSWGRSGATANNANFYNGTAAATETWTATVSSNLWTLANGQMSSRLLQWNNANPRFAAYTSAQVKLKLFKKTAANYTLTYNGNGNSGGSAPSTQTGASSYTVAGNTGSLTKTGFIWAGWAANTDGTGTIYGPNPYTTSSGTLTSNTTFYARWAYTVTYNANGGTGAPSTQTNYNSLKTTISTGVPTRSGYTFTGWNTAADGSGSAYSGGDLYNPDGIGSITLQAQWQLNSSPILSISGSQLYGSVCVGTADFPRSYTITNTGAAANGITVVSDNADFVVSNLSSTSIPTNGTATFDVTFTPSSAGTRAATITLETTTNGSSFTTINLTGTGRANGTPTVSISSNAANNTICSGTSVTFTATVPAASLGGGTVIYYWGVNGAAVGSNAATYTTSSLASSDLVNCSITVLGGCVTQNIATSNFIIMTVNPTPANPNGDIVLENPYCDSAALVYELSDPKETGVTYYWQTSANGTSMLNPLVFAPGSQLAEPYNVTAPGYYYVRAYNGSCWSAGSFVTQDPVVFTTAVSITAQPANQVANVGSSATFTVTATGTPTYQWQVSTNNGTNWTNISGATSASYSTGATTLLMSGYQYRVRLSNACNTISSNAATLTVADPPVSIWSNEITATNPSSTNPYVTGDVKNSNISVSGITRGSGITASSASGRFSASGWNSNALDINDYYEFTLTPNANYKIDFSSFQYTGQASGSGPVNFAFRSSLDGYATNIGTATAGGTSISLSAAAYQNIKVPVKFRIYAWGASAPGGTFSVNDFDFKGNVSLSCVPVSISAFPTSGPVNTVVVITGNNFTSGSTVKFGTAMAVAEYISPTQIKALVPVGADGNIIVDTSLSCDSETAFTLISTELTNCEVSSGGGITTPASDLVIYEVYDENGGTGGVVSIYNGTNASVNLGNYNLYRAGTYGSGYTNYATMSGTVAPGAIAVIGVNSTTGCRYTATNGTITGGFNEDDGFQLRKNAGATIVDDVRAPNYVGYYMKRNNAGLTPNTTYNDAQWTIQSLDPAQCLPPEQIAQTPGVKTAPVVNTQPGYSLSCDVVNASLSITASEGFANGNPLAYQWYVLGTAGTWTAITDTGVYTGATSQTLNISDVTGLNNHQYYCQVRENTATCFTATQATQVKEAQNTWSTNVWSNGMPVLGSKVIIAGSYDTEANGALNVCELTVNSTASLRVKPNFPIIIRKKITNLAAADNFVVESDANLIQQDNITNSGNIKVERAVTDMNNITGQIDYVYWSSPVSGQMIKGQTGFSPNTPANGYLQYNEINDKFTVTGDTTFQTGKGYAIRAEAGTNGYNKTYAFSGTPNNGDLQYQSLKYTDAEHGFNLVGNPYPSNIDFNLLHALNSSKIYSAAWFWTNNSYTPGQVGSGYSGNNYAVFNGTGGTPATSNPENPANNSITPDGTIKVGQAFIVQAKGNTTLDFNNGIRVTDNGGFFQKTNPKDRFWLTLTAPNSLVNTILIGYIPGATDNYETDFDGELFAVGSDSFYSLLGAKKLAIQGKSDDFTIEDKVTLGNIYSQNGTYKISLKNPEGIFNQNQAVYLKDNQLKKTIKLNDGAYSFQAVKGTDVTRFKIVYKEEEFLGADSATKSNFEVYRDGTDYVINSSRVLGQVEVYDAAGRLVISRKTINKSFRMNASALINGIYIIKVENSGDLHTKKIIR